MYTAFFNNRYKLETIVSQSLTCTVTTTHLVYLWEWLAVFYIEPSHFIKPSFNLLARPFGLEIMKQIIIIIIAISFTMICFSWKPYHPHFSLLTATFFPIFHPPLDYNTHSNLIYLVYIPNLCLLYVFSIKFCSWEKKSSSCLWFLVS